MGEIQNILVTGASGKLGFPLCLGLLKEGYRVSAAVHKHPVGIEGVSSVALELGDYASVEAAVAEADAVLHLASAKESREGLVDLSFRGTFNLLDACARTKRPERFILASGDCVNGIYFNRQALPIRDETPMIAYPGYYALSKVIEETLASQYCYQERVPAVVLRMSWIQAEDDIISHLTIAGEPFGVPVWKDLMKDDPGAGDFEEKDAAVSLLHPDGSPFRRHIVSVEDCVQSFLLALKTPSIEGETFNIAMEDPFDYREAAGYLAKKMGIDVLPLTDPVGNDFFMDITKAKYLLRYKPRHDIFSLIDKALDFRGSGSKRRERTGYKG